LKLKSGIVLFLGMVRRGEFETLAEHGLQLGVLVDSNSRARLGDVSGFALVERFDFSRPLPELIAAVREIDQRIGVACLFNVVEFYVQQTAEVAAALGLAGISPASAALCLDKTLMRQRFRQRIGRDAAAGFRAIGSESDLELAACEFGFPLFLQPANVSASMWATRNESLGALQQNYQTILDEVPRYYQRLGQKEKTLAIVAAEYLEGLNTSVDCLIDGAGEVYTTPAVDVLTGRDVGIDDFHHFARLLPSRLNPDQQEDLRRLAVAGAAALDMTSAAAHVEFIGRRLGEIGARPGGNRPRILDMAYGMDMLFAFYQMLSGQQPDLQKHRDLAAAIVTPFPSRNGTLRQIHHLERIMALPGYLYHEIRAEPGQAVGLARSGFRAPLYVELVSPNADQVRQAVDQIASWSDLYEVD
jgi:biotin carboxylase